MTDFISSLQNPRIKNIIKLEKSRERKSQNIFVIEGYREILKAIDCNFEISEFYYTPSTGNMDNTNEIITKLSSKVRLFEITKEVFEKIAYRENSDGLLALSKPKHKTLESLVLPSNPLILIIESVEKPGNLGAILRTADAAALDAVIVCDPQTDLYNPNVVRSSLGCIFTQQIAVSSTSETISFLKKKGIKTFGAALPATQFYHETDLTVPSAIVMGTEADGLSDTWLKQSDELIKIPMSGVADSLNVSTSAAILVFEAKRQRWVK